MTVTASAVETGGRTYVTIGSNKRTITDLSITEPSETATAADLGLSAVLWARAEIKTAVATDTAIYVNATVADTQDGITLALFEKDGAEATVDTAVVRVTAFGY